MSPKLLDAYRQGELSLEQVQAFTVSDDHAAQERVWEGFGTYGCKPNTIRHALTEGEIPTTDKRVRCVGLEAFEAAGGAVRRDIFDDHNGGYILDTALLDRLVQESLNAAAEEVRAEGCGWTEILPEFGYAARSQFEQCPQAEVPLPETEAAELEELLGEYDALSSDAVDEEGDERPDIAERLAQIEERVDALQVSRCRER